MTSPIVLILAAGRGERFLASGGKSHKLAAALGGKAVLQHVIQAVENAGLAWHLVRPEGGTPGMGDSIALGVDATREASGWLILPADLPLIQPQSLQRVAEALTKHSLVVPNYHHRPGHPVGFGREYLGELLALSGKNGAKAIVQLARQQGEVKEIPLTDYGIRYDIDTLADLEAAQRLLVVRG